MKTNWFFGLVLVAALGFVASNVNAQEIEATVPAATAVAPATQSVPAQPCDECDGVGFAGVGFGGFRGVGVPSVGLPGGGLRARIEDAIASDRPIVEASPFANPNGSLQDWQRFRYYPYGYYPHNFNDRANMAVPKYHPGYQNYYPVPRRFHEGHHFHLDVF